MTAPPAAAGRSEQAEFSQLAPQRLRHALGAGGDTVEVARGVVARKIAPALERAPRARLDQHELRLQHEMAATHALLVDKRTHVANTLPAHDLTADHPKERAAVAQLVGALGHHARPVHVIARKAASLARPELLADPVLEVAHGVATDAKLDEMQGHGGYRRTKCDDIIARQGCVATRRPSLSSEDGRCPASLACRSVHGTRAGSRSDPMSILGASGLNSLRGS